MTTSIQNFSTDQFVVTGNGREITDWGEANPPYTEEPIDPAASCVAALAAAPSVSIALIPAFARC